MSTSIETCSYSATVEDYKEWGGDPLNWPHEFTELALDGDTWNCPHEVLTGREYCPFHTDPGNLPADVDQSEELLAAIQASTEDEPDAHRRREFIGASFGDIHVDAELINDENNHPIYLTGATFEGCLELDFDCPFSVIANLVVVNDCVYLRRMSIEGRVDFTQGTIKGTVSLWGTTIMGEALFISARIEENARFRQTIIEDRIELESATIGGGLDLTSATIGGRARFYEMTVQDRAVFLSITINEEASFGSVEINGKANLRGVAIESSCSFGDATIDGPADFTGITIEGRADFGGTTINGWADFSGSRIADGAEFGRITIDGETYFERMIVRGNVLFTPLGAGVTTFSGPVSFREARIEGTADFSTSEVEEGIRRTDFEERPSFTGVEFTDADFTSADISGADFSDAELTDAEFNDATMTGADFSKAELTDADFTDAHLLWARFEQSRLSRATLFSADLRGAQLSGVVLGDARINEQTRILGSPNVDKYSDYTVDAGFLSKCCVYDPDFGKGSSYPWPIRWLDGLFAKTTTDTPSADDSPGYVDLPEPDLDRAKSVYRSIENAARENARSQLQSQAFIRRQEIQRNQYSEVAGSTQRSLEEQTVARLRWIRASVAKWVLLYGESPWRVIAWALGIIYIFALLYPIGGWMVPVSPGGTPNEPITWGRILGSFPDGLVLLGKSVYYSTLTFTTLGFGDFRPVGIGQALTTIETALGAVLIALLVFVLGRRAAR